MCRIPFAVMLVGALVACGRDAVRSVCLSDADCGEKAACIQGSCQSLPDDPAPDAVDAGSIDDCDEPCGTTCCQPGTECRNAHCVPRCESGVWCGSILHEVCCERGLQCEHGACVLSRAELVRCPLTQVWDEQLGACVAPVPIEPCERPRTDSFTPEVLWEVSPTDPYRQVIVTPIVIDLDGDGASDVVAPFFDEMEGPAVLRALSGIDGHVLWETLPSGEGLSGISQLAAAVLGPGEPPTIVGMDRVGTLSAYSGATGERLWRSHDKDGAPVQCDSEWGAPAIADLDGNAHPEIICGFTVFDSRGELWWSHPVSSGPLGAIVAIGDLNSDGRLDLTDGTRAYRHDGALLWSLVGVPGGIAAVADLMTANGAIGRDGFPEVVVARRGELEIRDGASGLLLTPALLLPTWDGSACYPHPSPPGIGGAPAVGDTDGDGVPEIVVASGQCLAAIALRYNPVGTELYMLWGMRAVDESSSVTGVALFDFDADGKLDVVHADETRLHIVEGNLAAWEFSQPHCSGTVYEFPAVADVDGDGSANVVLGRNEMGRVDLNCDQGARPGIVVLREKKSRWANARGIWNQHAYVAPQICDGADSVCAELGPIWGAHGMVPMDSMAAWSFREPGAPFPYNASRANTRGPWEPRWTADATISHVVADTRLCPALLTARVRVVNRGQTPLRPGTRVVVRSPGGDVWAGTVTRRPIPPGHAEVLDIPIGWANGSANVIAEVDTDDRTAECREDNNAFGPVLLACP